jgi:hypothetical protein
MLRRTILLSLMAISLSFSNAFAQDKKAAPANNVEKGKYQNVVVAPFTAQSDLKITPEQLKDINDAVIKELQDIKKFKQVLREGETPTDASAPTLKITGTIVKFKAGSRTKRYLVGFGAGKSKIIANVQYIDRDTGNVLVEHAADGDVVMGIFGGNSGGAKSELAEDVAKFAKKTFF